MPCGPAEPICRWCSGCGTARWRGSEVRGTRRWPRGRAQRAQWEAEIEKAEEAAALARVRAGDRAAYAVLVMLHAPIAKRLAVLSGAGSEADDVVQEAFVKAYQSSGRFRDGAGFRPWLLRIVVNETPQPPGRGAPACPRESRHAARTRPMGRCRPSARRDRSACPTRRTVSATAFGLPRRHAATSRGRHVPLPARAVGGRDRPRPRHPGGHRQVPAAPGARVAAGGDGRWLTIHALEAFDRDLERELVATRARAWSSTLPAETSPSACSPVSTPCRRGDEPAGGRLRRPGRRRLGWAIAAAVVLVLALIPPVRAAVLELLRIGGVVVREEPRPSPNRSRHPAVRWCASPLRARVGARPRRRQPRRPSSCSGSTSLSRPRSGRRLGRAGSRGTGGRADLGRVTRPDPARRLRRVPVVGLPQDGLGRRSPQPGWTGHEAVVVRCAAPARVGRPAGAPTRRRPGSPARRSSGSWGPGGTEVTYRLEGPPSLPEALRVAQSAR